MYKTTWLFVFFVTMFSVPIFGQTNEVYTYPVLNNCGNLTSTQLENCFNTTVKQALLDSLQIPEHLKKQNYKGDIAILFEVNENRELNVLYVETPYDSLKSQVFKILQNIKIAQPARYLGRPTYMQFRVSVKVPLDRNYGEDTIKVTGDNFIKDASGEIARSQFSDFKNGEFTSQLNIPFSHQRYRIFDQALNQIGANAHTAVKPYTFDYVQEYFDLQKYQQSLAKPRTSWWGRKWWNEHMVRVSGEDFWLTIDPAADLQLGKDNSDQSYTYNNTRAVYVQGGIGKKFAFSTSVYESQGRFADYFNDYAESIKPDGGNPAIIPGRGIAKGFGDGGFDYPVAEGYVSYSPSKHFNLQLGHGKNFIGDGYRSLLMSDVTSPYPYFKLSTSFWKIKYTNIWMSLKDVRPEVTQDRTYLTKYIAAHYLNFNVTDRLNLGLYEAVIWKNDNNRGFDFNYLNPVIFYNFIEFSVGSRTGNSIIGGSGKYKISNNFNLYGQFVLDELTIKEFLTASTSWKNKYGIQLGAKWYNAFNNNNLMLQFEFNQVRPYVYSHDKDGSLNYANNNLAMAHILGSNFREGILIANYNYNRWFGELKLMAAQKGLDYDDGLSYGGDIYKSYDDRPSDYNVKLLQGNKTAIFNGNIQAGYLINPATNLKAYINLSYRSYNPDAVTSTAFSQNTVWFTIGFRTDLFNWYFDF
ncbi:gliding motility protein RemB [Zhouia sp. PK063]|uniref:gliding motility protein RemB n=1 Tax=Zhouia sp. PK063 TaxID=3373602 RepID=UPI00378A4DFC